jgi:hypothetical protein
MKFDSIVPYIKNRLVKHHQMYSAPCKAEYWEENLCVALKQSGFGSNWKPDFNHKSGKDQTTDAGIRISNKSGTLYLDSVTISGSRLTKHKTIESKIEFLSTKKEDYIFCLSTEKEDWQKDIKRYYFIVIDAEKLNYHEQKWIETRGQRGSLKDSISGWSCVCEAFSASIRKNMSDQLWTTIKLDYCDEIYEIEIE